MKKTNTAIMSSILLATSIGALAEDMTCDPEWGFIDQVICRTVMVPVFVAGGLVIVLSPVMDAIGNIFPVGYYPVNVTLNGNPAVPAEISYKCGKAIQSSPKHTVKIDCSKPLPAKGGSYCTLSDPFDNLGHGNVTTPIFVSQEGVPDVLCLKLLLNKTAK
jgi:hypothetical protein